MFSIENIFAFFETRKDLQCALLAQQLLNIGEIEEDFIDSSEWLQSIEHIKYTESKPHAKLWKKEKKNTSFKMPLYPEFDLAQMILRINQQSISQSLEKSIYIYIYKSK